MIQTKALPNKFLNRDIMENSFGKEESTQQFHSLPDYLNNIEYQIIARAQKEHDSTRKAANALGMTQSTYFRRLKKYGLSET